jgi:hypothetical protein
MENMRRWINYDWFKLIVALILLVIFFLLLLRQPPPGVTVTGANPAVTGTSVVVLAPTTLPSLPPTPSSTATQPTANSVAAPTQAASATSVPIQPTATLVAAPAQATSVPIQPTATSAAAPAQAASPMPQATTVPTQPPAGSLTPSAPSASGDCSKALPTRLEVGKKATVTTHLFLRKAAGIDQAVLLTNLPGTTLEILGGPVCIPYGSGVYRWWNVKTAAGPAGWSAEGALTGQTYFMDPVP